MIGAVCLLVNVERISPKEDHLLHDNAPATARRELERGAQS